MSSRYGPSSRRIWSLAGSGLGTTISAGGNSGAWQAPAPPPWSPNAVTPVDLRDVNDIWLTCCVMGAIGGTGSPSLTVSLNLFDDSGNLFPGVSVAAVTATGAGIGGGGKSVAAGAHGAAASSFLILPDWGQVSWVVAGTTPSFTGVDISLWAR
jgi:hypothetical protein